MARIRYRLDDWRWRLRYWWLDTESGKHAHVYAFVASLLVLVYQVFKLALAALLPPPATGERAFVWWVVQLIIAIVSAILSYILRPKVPEQPQDKIKGPTVEDGRSVNDRFGIVVVKDPHLIAWRVMRIEKIKKGGKK